MVSKRKRQDRSMRVLILISENKSNDDANNGTCDRQAQIQRTVAIIKPDGLPLKQKIIEKIQSKQFKILQERTLQLTKNQAKEVFESQKDFEELITWTSR